MKRGALCPNCGTKLVVPSWRRAMGCVGAVFDLLVGFADLASRREGYPSGHPDREHEDDRVEIKCPSCGRRVMINLDE